VVASHPKIPIFGMACFSLYVLWLAAFKGQGQGGTNFEIRSTKPETNSNVQKINDQNRADHNLG